MLRAMLKAIVAVPLAFALHSQAYAGSNTSEPGTPAVEERTCRGTDMLPELKASDPDAYARIEREAKVVSNGDALLWRIERPGMAPSHIFGTVHLTDERVTVFSPKMREALDQSRIVLLETSDISDSAHAAALAAASKTTIFTDGRSLEKMLPSDDFAKVQTMLSRAGVPTDAAHLYRPWVITMLIAASDCERRKMQEGSPVLDMKIANEAKARGTPVAGLETIEEQLSAMTSLPEDEQLDMLRASLKYIDRTDDLVETMIQLYLDRRMGAMWPFQLALAARAGVGASSYAAFRRTLIVDRNFNMRDSALRHIENGGAFIAVGALHLPGETGLIALLRAKGYTLTPIE